MTTVSTSDGPRDLTASQDQDETDPSDLQEIEEAVSKTKFISLKDARRAAKNAGFAIAHVGKVRAHAKYGEYLGKLNPVAIGRSELAFNLQKIEEVLNECHKFSKTLMSEFEKRKLDDPQLLVSLFKVRRDLLETHGKSATAMIESSKLQAEDRPNPMPTSPSFSPQMLARNMVVYNEPKK